MAAKGGADVKAKAVPVKTPKGPDLQHNPLGNGVGVVSGSKVKSVQKLAPNEPQGKQSVTPGKGTPMTTSGQATQKGEQDSRVCKLLLYYL